jgi:hypothetical protein
LFSVLHNGSDSYAIVDAKRQLGENEGLTLVTMVNGEKPMRL